MFLGLDSHYRWCCCCCLFQHVYKYTLYIIHKRAHTHTRNIWDHPTHEHYSSRFSNEMHHQQQQQQKLNGEYNAHKKRWNKMIVCGVWDVQQVEQLLALVIRMLVCVCRNAYLYAFKRSFYSLNKKDCLKEYEEYAFAVFVRFVCVWCMVLLMLLMLSQYEHFWMVLSHSSCHGSGINVCVCVCVCVCIVQCV